jgi:hypothetical protein
MLSASSAPTHVESAELAAIRVESLVVIVCKLLSDGLKVCHCSGRDEGWDGGGASHTPSQWSPHANLLLGLMNFESLSLHLITMAGGQQEAPRPSMRRKSSAQNLLSSFKSSTVHTPTGTPAAISSSGYFPNTPTGIIPTPRDWEQSTMVDSASTGVPSAGGSPALGSQGTSIEFLRDLVQKRIITLTYMRNVHEG